jgi:uncharacterized membrane protein
MNQESEAVGRNVPPFEPGVLSSYGHGWRQLWKYILELFLIGLIAFFIGLPSAVMSHSAQEMECAGVMIWLMAIAYGILLTNPMEYGVSFAYLKASRGDKLEIKDMFHVFQNYWNAVMANLLVAIIIIFGFIMLIVPGIIFACRLAFVSYLVVDRKMDVIPAVKESWRLTRGHANKVFLIALLAIPISIAGLLCLLVGIIPAVMWIQSAFASLYYSVSVTKGEQGEEVVAQTGPVRA